MEDARLEAKLDKIADKIANIDTTLAKQAILLDEHIKRTDLLEKQVEPIQDRMIELKGAISLIKIVSVLVAVAEGVRHLLLLK